MSAPATPIPVAVAGAAGRLGSAVVRRLADDPRFRLSACLDRPESPRLGSAPGPDLAHLPTLSADSGDWGGAKLLFESSREEAVARHVEHAANSGVGVLIAVTALGEASERAVQNAATRVPVLVAPNLSFGAALLAHLSREAARLWPEADIAIVETHHTQKRDRPSGTAKWLERSVGAGRAAASDPESAARSVDVHSLRLGTVVGDHRVWLAGAGERLELAHIAESRETFAAGAVRALFWLAHAEAGRYTLEDLTGAKR